MIDKAEFIDSLLPLLKSGITFAAYCLPGHAHPEYIIDDCISPTQSSRKFIISTWSGERIEIRDCCVAINSLPDNKEIAVTPPRCSTPRQVYEKGIETVTELLRSSEGKVVISRQELLSDSRLSYPLIAGAVYDMFNAYGNAFRAVYYTPETGAWCVCSPELLLHVDKIDGSLSTVALAGTRNCDIEGEWDDKNLSEHSYVVRHIAEVFRQYGITPVISGQQTFATGKIHHILTKISGKMTPDGHKDLAQRLLQSLHPTPAICGYPIEKARAIIKQIETHDRECYGGYIAVEDDKIFHAHVNLRCFAFAEGCCCFWGGGGIMPDSTPQTEWTETQLKIDSTLSFIRPHLSTYASSIK